MNKFKGEKTMHNAHSWWEVQDIFGMEATQLVSILSVLSGYLVTWASSTSYSPSQQIIETPFPLQTANLEFTVTLSTILSYQNPPR